MEVYGGVVPLALDASEQPKLSEPRTDVTAATMDDVTVFAGGRCVQWHFTRFLVAHSWRTLLHVIPLPFVTYIS